jgi:hypothetical protein
MYDLYGGFGDARSDIVSALAVVMGRDKAEAWMKSLEAIIKAKAEEGAKAAIPTIQAKIKPYVIGAAAVGGLGALLGLVAIARSGRKK